MKIQIQPSNLAFLKLLGKNNNRDWFNANKEKYLKELADMENFTGALLMELNKHDVIETPSGKKALHRIYRDTRFSKDKTPYKDHWGASFSRSGKSRRGTYYLQIEPHGSFAAGGFWGPGPADLKRIRDEFSYDPGPFRKILKSKKFIETFGTLQGEQIKTTPKGFNADDPALDLLRFRQFQMIRFFTDKEVLTPGFLKEVNMTFKNMRPFLDYMSEVLTTDVNGISVI